jgi:DNA-binding MarR family transcriptional regulator
MDLELTDLFHNNKEQKMQAVKLLDQLNDKEINQKGLAELLGIDEMAVSRLVRTLEAHGYLGRERGLHAEWRVRAV